MTLPSITDHLLILLIAVAYPVYASLVWYWRSRPRLQAGEPGALVGFYRSAIIELWLLAAVALAWWFSNGRAAAGIGLGAPCGWAFWVGVIVAGLAAITLARQVVTVRSSAEARAQARKQLGGSTALIVPRSAPERRIAVGASLTAGFCEEVLYRGFLLWYLMTWLPAPVAVAISAVVFGLAHVYQGLGGVIKAVVAGAVLGVGYLLTGSLWAPILLHATVDVTSLLTTSIALEDGKGAEAT